MELIEEDESLANEKVGEAEVWQVVHIRAQWPLEQNEDLKRVSWAISIVA